MEKNKRFIPLYFDLLFKKIFGDINNPKPIRLLLKLILKINPKETNVLNSELISRPYIDKNTAVDLMLELEDKSKVGTEVNSKVDSTIIDRNLFLMCLNMTKDLGYSEDYENLNKHCQINFDMAGHHDKPITSYSIREDETNKLLTDMIKIVRIDVPFFTQKCYNEDVQNLDQLTRFIGMFGAKSEEELKSLCEGDEELEEIYKQYKKYVNDKDVIGAYNAKLREKEFARVEKEEALEENTKKVTKEVTKKVTEQSKIEIAKNLLKETKDLELISRVTGLDIETIKGLQ